MQKDVLINAGAGEIRVAVVEDGRLQDLMLERTIGLEDGGPRKKASGRSGHSLIGNIILGRVQRVLPGMQAAFVDVGLERAGFLGAREARCLADLPGYDEDRTPKIGDCVHEGEEILVQVVKDPIGEKGARLSANITIPGRLAVLVPNTPGVLGTSTDRRPGMVMLAESRAPLSPIGSLTTWTRISSPSRTHSPILGVRSSS